MRIDSVDVGGGVTALTQLNLPIGVNDYYVDGDGTWFDDWARLTLKIKVTRDEAGVTKFLNITEGISYTSNLKLHLLHRLETLEDTVMIRLGLKALLAMVRKI